MANYVNAAGVDCLEDAVKDLKQASSLYESMGFTCLGRRTEPTRRSKLYGQGDIRLVLTASSTDADPVAQFVAVHGDGVIDIALKVDGVDDAIGEASRRGARALTPPRDERGHDGRGRRRAEIAAFGDVRHSFTTYEARVTLEDFFPEERVSPSDMKGIFFQTVDHITVNMEKGRMEPTVQFYQNVFGFTEVRYFDIRTAKSGLISRAMRSPNGRITMPFNEPTNEKSQIQEFLNTFHGPGVQHVAFHVTDIIASLKDLTSKGFEFLSVPGTYYDAVPKRVPNVRESMEELKRLNILVDGTDKGYLLQIFSQNLVGPLFYELIQRRGDNGFGEGNFRALFESIERDQERRGVI